MKLKVKIKRIKDEAVLPGYAHSGDVGMDLFSLEDYKLKPGERRVFYLGFALDFPEGFAAIVKDKSSLPKNGGIHTMAGVYDAGYRGEYNVNLINLGGEPYKVSKGDKVAQLVFFPVAFAELEETNELSKSDRGEGRFGSTGK